MAIREEKFYRSRNFRLILGLVFIFVIAFILGYFVGRSTSSSKDNNSEENNEKREFDINTISPDEIHKNFMQITKKPHIAGTEREEVELVNLIKERWNSQLDHVDVHTYNVLLSYPNESNPNYVAMVDVTGKEYDKTPFKEPPVTESENFDDVGNYFNAYGAAGRVQGQLVYVNYASLEDFVFLNDSNISTKGKICIARYGRLYRGDKAAMAGQSGCIGLILYSDPQDDGNPVDHSHGYPYSFWIPETGVQWGSVLEGNGDPLTPSYPSLDYMYRISESEATVLPKIPVQPIGFIDAYKYISKLGGDDAPKEWQGGFNITYKFGGEFKTEFANGEIVLFSDNYRTRKNINNVVGYIWGEEEPDRYIIIGNHRDAWGYGGVDNSISSATLLEVTRALGESIKKENWRPKRTIVFCSWGAEEYGLIGSYEWVETYKRTLMLNAVLYINVDSVAYGNVTFDAGTSPNLIKVIREVTKEIPNPDADEIKAGRDTVYDTWLFRKPDKDDPSQPATNTLGSGSDFTAFLQTIGVSCLALGYSGINGTVGLSYKAYHSSHDTLEYYERFIDPEYKVSTAVGQVISLLVLRFANDAILPFDCELYGKVLKKNAEGIVAQYKSQLDNNKISYDGFLTSFERFQSSCATFTSNSVKSADEDNQLMTRRLNDKLMMLERGFIDDNGLPGRTHYKHVAFAPSRTNAYGGVGFSGIVDTIYDAMNDGNWTPVQEQFAIIQFIVDSATNVFSLGMPLSEL